MKTTRVLPCFGWDAFIVFLCGGVALVVWWRGFDYLSGVTNLGIEKPLPFGRLLLYFTVGMMILLCIGIMVTRVLCQWKSIPLWADVARIGIIVSVCIVVVGAVSGGSPGIYRFAQGCEVWVRREADIKSIRDWASDLVAPPASGRIPRAVWPECVVALSPRDVDYVENGKGVRLRWGGGFIGDYGLVVGVDDVLAPETAESDLIVRLEPGVYLYFPGQ